MPVDDGQGAATGLKPGADVPPVPTVRAGAGRLAVAFAMLSARAEDAAAFLLTGGIYIVAGGFVAALTRPLDLSLGSWAAAYLVLVGGVAQIAIGGVQVAVTVHRPSRRLLAAEYLCFNAGNVLVVAGATLRLPWLVDLGGAVLAVSLGLFIYAARGARAGWAVRLYDAVLAVVLASIPVGLLLGHLRG